MSGGALSPERAALEQVCIHSNPDWREARADPAATLDLIHTTAVDAFYSPQKDARTQAIAAASSAAEAVHELLAFAREGNQLGNTAFSVSVGEKLADAFRLSIEAQGGPDDDDEARCYAAAVKYLDPAAIVIMPARSTFPQKQKG